MRDFKVKIETEEAFFADITAQAKKIDAGVIPETPVERISFPDLETFYRCCNPDRFKMLQKLHLAGGMDSKALARQLHRRYRNVCSDIRLLEAAGLVEKNADGHYHVPWNEIHATIRL